MIYIKDLDSGKSVFNALDSDLRIEILKQLIKNKEMSLDELAKALNVTNGAITKHSKILEESGLINIRLLSSHRGTKKICSVSDEKILIDVVPTIDNEKKYSIEYNVGQFTNFSINPTCGYASLSGLNSDFDNVKNFSNPERFNANILWFTDGFLEYNMSNPIQINEKIREIQISFELAGESPGGITDYPSKCQLYFNNFMIANITLPGEYIDRKGKLTPSFWNDNFGQYGKLRLFTINNNGCYIEGLKSSDTTLDEILAASNDTFSFKIATQTNDYFIGGVTLFGKDFGDYNQGIKFNFIISEK